MVNFTPARGHGYGDFADEKYYPPVSSKKPKHSISRQLGDFPPEDDYAYAYSSFRKKPEPQRFARLGEANDNEADFQDEEDQVLRQSSPVDPMNVNANFGDVSRSFRELAQRLNKKYEEPMYRLRRQPRREDNNLRSFEVNRMNVNHADTAKDIPKDDLGDDVERHRRFRNSKLEKEMWKLMMMNATLQKRYEDDFAGLEFMNNEGEDDASGEEDDRWLNRNTGDEESEAQDDDDQANQEREDVSWTRRDMGEVNNHRESGLYTEGGLVQPLDLHDVIKEGEER